MMIEKFLNEYKEILGKIREFDQNKIPLCAAENYVSSFVKSGLISEFEGKYIQGYKNRDRDKDNIEGDILFELLNLVEKLCNKIYNAKHADSRTLTGMNCISIVIQALVNKGDKVIISEKDMGGHASLPKILDNLGIEYIGIPYDYCKMDIDYEKLNKILEIESFSFLIFCQSDLIRQPNFNKISLPLQTGLIYDASQTLGLIGAKLIDNPLSFFEKSLLIGGSHKTLPGPCCGLILTNNDDYADTLDSFISPSILRNVQPNNIASLCLALIEQCEFGEDYQFEIVNTANLLGMYLENYNVPVIKIAQNRYTETHQLFISYDEKHTDRIYSRARKYNITLNKKNMKMFSGIRLGVQEIARYKYSEKELENVAKLISLLSKDIEDVESIEKICSTLKTKKRPYYILDDFLCE